MRAFPVIYHVFFQKIQDPLTTFTPGLLEYAMAWLSFEAIKKTTVQGLSCNNYPSQTAIQRAYPSQQSALRDHFTLAIFRNVKSRLARCVVKDTMLYEI